MCRWQDFQNPPQMYKSFVIACLILIYFSDVLLLIRQTARFLFARQPFAFLSHSLTQFFSLSPNFLLSLRLTNEAGDCTALRARSQEKTSAPRAHATDAEQGCYFLFCFVFSFLSRIVFFFLLWSGWVSDIFILLSARNTTSFRTVRKVITVWRQFFFSS